MQLTNILRNTQEQSKQLLEIAKTGVERAILLQRGYANEEDEERAIAWMNQQLEALGVDLG